MIRQSTLVFGAFALASAAMAQTIVCLGTPFTRSDVLDPRQSFEAALQWRLGQGHTVRCLPVTGNDWSDSRPDVVVIADGQARATVSLASRWVDLSASLHDAHLPTDAIRDPFVADRLAALVARAITGFHPPVTTTAVPSPEHRAAAAGWGTGSWWDQHEGLRSVAEANRDLEILFLGDSITQALTGVHDRLARVDGVRAFDRQFGTRRAAAFGIAGDRTQHLLFRLRRGEIRALRPRVIVLQIGINNVSAGDDSRAIAAGIEAIVDELRATQPQAHVVICGPFPAGRDRDAPARRVVADIHERLRRWPREERVLHRDLAALFLHPDGTPSARLAADHLHVSEAGREAWLTAISIAVRSLAD